MQEQNFQYGSLYPLSDVLQLDIDIYTDGLGNFEFKGSRNWILPILNTDFKLKLKIEASNLGEYDVGLLLSVSKNFWIYATYSNLVDVKGITSLYYLDIKGVNSKMLSSTVSKLSFEEALVYLTPYFRVKYTKKVEDTVWVKGVIDPQTVSNISI